MTNLWKSLSLKSGRIVDNLSRQIIFRKPVRPPNGKPGFRLRNKTNLNHVRKKGSFLTVSVGEMVGLGKKTDLWVKKVEKRYTVSKLRRGKD